MAEIKTFRLSDLGENLPDAVIVKSHVKPGDRTMLNAMAAS